MTTCSMMMAPWCPQQKPCRVAATLPFETCVLCSQATLEEELRTEPGMMDCDIVNLLCSSHRDSRRAFWSDPDFGRTGERVQRHAVARLDAAGGNAEEVATTLHALWLLACPTLRCKEGFARERATAVVGALSRHSGHEKVGHYGMMAVWSLCLEEAGQAVWGDAGAVEAATKFLRLPREDGKAASLDVLEAACTAIWNLVAGCGVNVMRANESEAIPGLHQALILATSFRETAQGPTTAVAALSALWALSAAGHADVRRNVHRAGVTSATAHALEQFKGQTRIAAAGAGLLHALTQDGEAAEAAANCGVVPLMGPTLNALSARGDVLGALSVVQQVVAMAKQKQHPDEGIASTMYAVMVVCQSHASDETLMRASLSVLRSLSVQCPPGLEPSDCALSALVAMAGHPNSAAVQERGCGLIRNLAAASETAEEGKATRAALQAAGCVEALLQALRVHQAEQPTVARTAVEGLLGLSFQDAACLSSIVEQGGLELIGAAIEAHPARKTVVAAGARFLWNTLQTRPELKENITKLSLERLRRAQGECGDAPEMDLVGHLVHALDGTPVERPNAEDKIRAMANFQPQADKNAANTAALAALDSNASGAGEAAEGGVYIYGCRETKEATKEVPKAPLAAPEPGAGGAFSWGTGFQ